MDLKKIKDQLNKFGKDVVLQSRKNLKKDKKDVKGTLSKSINYIPAKATEDGIVLSFEMEDYGIFQDRGVSGVKNKYNTSYSYKSKGGKRGLKGMPPAKPLDLWSIRKLGLKKVVRDKKGRFVPRKSLVFLIRRKIFLQGIKPSLFFTKPFEAAFKKLPKDIELSIDWRLNKK